MRITQALSAVLLCTMIAPAVAQDFLAPLQDMVDELTGAPAERRPAPRAEPAEAGDQPPVPRPRPPSLPDVPQVQLPTPPQGSTPEAEPAAAAVEPEEPGEPERVEEPGVAEPQPDSAPEAVVEPVAKPPDERIYQTACPAVIQGLVEAQIAPPLRETQCGEQSPWIVTAVMSRGRMVPLSSPITTNCEMASALPGWVSDVDGYAQAMLESPLASITTGTSYMCRPRVGADTGFTSEHGFANAVDVVGFTLADGRSIALPDNWLSATAPEGRLLRLAHDAACGGFTTVLGPEANAEHRDHLHLDMGCHGQSCEARICQ